MKILLDVGAHIGQSARAALDPRYGFDKIVCFEPAPPCWPQIESIADPRVELVKFGLWKETCKRDLYRGGFVGASIFPDMENLTQSEAPALSIELVRARDWFRANVPNDALVFMKLNCEGSECDIIDDLLDAGELAKVYNVMVDFDVRFVPSLRKRELEVRRHLKDAGYRGAVFSDDVMKGATHEERLRNWLETVGAHENLDRRQLEAKYQRTLQELSRKSGLRARLRLAFRRNVFVRLPLPMQNAARRVVRAFRGA
jgi:FkbM family methyltransferase